MSKKGTQTTTTDLRYKGFKDLKKLPKEILSQSSSLKELDLTGNEILFKVFKGFNSLTNLNISKNKLKEIPQCITDIPSLKILDVSSNEISVLPQFLSCLKHLEEINISYNKFNEIPPHISNMEKLRRIHCAYNTITQFPQVLIDMKITSFNVAGNQLDNFPTHIPNMQMLSQLIISDNSIRTIPDLCKELVNLQILDLHNNKISELPSGMFAKMTKLTKINALNNPLKSIPAIDKLPQLKVLLVSDCTEASLTSMVDISANTELEELTINNTPLVELPSLQENNRLAHVNVQHNQLVKIQNIPRRCGINASYNKIEEVSIQKHVELPYLILGHNAFTPKTTPDLSPCETIDKLDLSLNKLTAIRDESFHASLKEIILNGNPLTVVPSGLSICTNLTNVSMVNCQLYELSKEIVQGICNVKVLNLSNNNFVSFDNFDVLGKVEELTLNSNGLQHFPRQILSMNNMKKLSLANNRIRILPDDLAKLKSLEEIDLGTNQIMNIKMFEQCTTLKSIDVSYNYITDVPNLTPMVVLEELNLLGNPVYDNNQLILQGKKLNMLNTVFAVQRPGVDDLEFSGPINDKMPKKLQDLTNFAFETRPKKAPKLPKTTREEFLFNAKNHGEIGVSFGKGEQKEMKNTVLISRNIFKNSLLLGLFDGQFGSKCAKFCSHEFMEIFLKKIAYNVTEIGITEAFKFTFEKLNQMIAKTDIQDGCAATFVMYCNENIYICSCGSQKCLLIKEKGYEQIGKDFAIKEDDEKRTVIGNSGVIENGKIMDEIDSTRCIGNVKHQNYMILTPDVKKVEWKNDQRMILCASREVYEVISQEELDGLMRMCINMQPSGIATYIRDIAVMRGAKSNITVAVFNLEQYNDAKKL